MAAQYDGSIIIDSELDVAGFDKGSEKLLKAIETLTAAVNGLGEKLSQSFQRAEAPIKAAAETARRGAESAAEATGKYDAALEKQQAKIDKQKEKMTAYYQAIEAVKASTDEWLKTSTSGEQTERIMEIEAQQLQELEVQYAKQISELERLEEEYRRISAVREQASRGELAPSAPVGRTTEEPIDLSAFGKAWQAMKQAAPLTQQIKESFSRMKASVVDFGRQIQIAFFAAVERFGAFKNAVIHFVSHPLQTLNQAAGSVAAGLSSLLRSGLSVLPGRLLETAKAIGRVSWTGFVKGVRLSAAYVRKLGSVLKATVSKLRSFGAGLLSFGKNSGQASLTANALVKSLFSVKRMLIGRVKRTFISLIFSEAKEAVKSLAQFSGTFNKAVSNVKNAYKELAGNLAVTIGSVVQTIEPVITRAINAISTAVRYVNAFFAMMSGKKTMTVAKKQTDSYADSLKEVSAASKDAQKQLAGFDELNILQDQSTDTTDTMASAKDLFEQVEIASVLPAELQSIFEEMKALWEKGDYFNFGAKLAEGLNYAVKVGDDWINGTFRPAGTQWTANIAEILNGLFAGWDAEATGKLLADGLNALLDIVNTFLTTFDFEAAGDNIGDVINGFFSNFDWALAGRTFANGWNALVGLIRGIVHKTNWALAGDGFAAAVQSFFDTVDWNKTADTISTGINGIVTLLQHFLDGVDWTGQAVKFATGINTLIQGVDWAAAGQMLSTAFIDFLHYITVVIETTDWQQLGRDIATFVGSIDWSGVVTALAEGIGAAMGALAGLLWGLIQDAWDSVVQWWYDAAFEDGQFTISGLLAGIVEAVKNIADWIREHIFQPFIEGFKKAFGINSPSTVMEEQGGFIIDGLWQGIQDAWDTLIKKVKAFASDLVETFSGKVKDMLAAGKDLLGKLEAGLEDAWDNVKTAVTGYAESLLGFFTEKFGALKDAGTSLMSNLKDGLASIWEGASGVKTKVTGWAKNIYDTFNNKKGDLKNAGITLFANLHSGLSNRWTNLQTNVSTMANNLWKTFNNQQTNMGTVGHNLAVGLYNGLKNKLDNLKDHFTSLANWVTGLFTKAYDEHSPSKVFYAIGQFLGIGLDEGIESEKKSLLSTVSNLASAMTSEMQDADLSVGPMGAVEDAGGVMSDFSDKITGGLYALVDKLQAIADNVVFRMPDIADGTVVPYRVAAAASAPGAEEEGTAGPGGGEAYLDILQEILQALLAGRSMTLDGKEIARNTYRHISQMKRAGVIE